MTISTRHSDTSIARRNIIAVASSQPLMGCEYTGQQFMNAPWSRLNVKIGESG